MIACALTKSSVDILYESQINIFNRIELITLNDIQICNDLFAVNIWKCESGHHITVLIFISFYRNPIDELIWSEKQLDYWKVHRMRAYNIYIWQSFPMWFLALWQYNWVAHYASWWIFHMVSQKPVHSLHGTKKQPTERGNWRGVSCIWSITIPMHIFGLVHEISR